MLFFKSRTRVVILVVILVIVVGIGYWLFLRSRLCGYPSERGAKFVFNDAENIYTMNTDGSGFCRLTYDGADNQLPAWSPDGRQIAFFSRRDNSTGIYLMNADGSDVRKVKNVENPGGLDWSPDGTQLAYNAGNTVAIIALDGSPVRTLTTAPYGLVDWSPDRKRITFVASPQKRTQERQTEIGVIDTDGSNQRQVTFQPEGPTVPTTLQDPRWSPDGTMLAFDDKARICLVNADGTNQRCLENVDPAKGVNSFPAWSPDGTLIAFSAYSFDEKTSGLYIMKPDGSELRRVSDKAPLNLNWAP